MREFSDAPYSLARMTNQPVLYIVRHGSTGDDERYNSPVNDPLNEKGQEDARQAASFLSGKPLGRILTSEQDRATQTANIMGQRLGRMPIVNRDLDSLNVGDVKDAASDEEADKVIRHHFANPHLPFPNGESPDQFSARVLPIILRSIQNYYMSGRPDALIAHHSTQHEAGKQFNGDKDSALTETGGILGIYPVVGGFEAEPIFKSCKECQ